MIRGLQQDVARATEECERVTREHARCGPEKKALELKLRKLQEAIRTLEDKRGTSTSPACSRLTLYPLPVTLCQSIAACAQRPPDRLPDRPARSPRPMAARVNDDLRGERERAAKEARLDRLDRLERLEARMMSVWSAGHD